jgi:hypothetical protein
MPDSGRSPGAPVTDFLHAWSGGDREALDMDVVEMGGLRIDHALTDLATVGQRKGHVVELRVFAGLSVDESARLSGLSPATIGRDWKFARSWLERELTR